LTCYSNVVISSSVYVFMTHVFKLYKRIENNSLYILISLLGHDAREDPPKLGKYLIAMVAYLIHTSAAIWRII